ncbi:hypothetical protein BC827DRAFT_811695 [Russula dissimulans]|nr:hypothetical protein BC827DRAFT_811695 [Russula dissimulans]
MMGTKAILRKLSSQVACKSSNVETIVLLCTTPALHHNTINPGPVTHCLIGWRRVPHSHFWFRDVLSWFRKGRRSQLGINSLWIHLEENYTTIRHDFSLFRVPGANCALGGVSESQWFLTITHDGYRNPGTVRTVASDLVSDSLLICEGTSQLPRGSRMAMTQTAN